MSKRLPIKIALSLVVACTTCHAANLRNEITLSGSQGLSRADYGTFGSVGYLRIFDNGIAVGGSLGVGSVLQDRTSVHMSGRAALRFDDIAGLNIRPQIQLEYARGAFMGMIDSEAIYLNIGFLGLVSSRFVYGLELQHGNVAHRSFDEPKIQKNVSGLRASMGVAF